MSQKKGGVKISKVDMLYPIYNQKKAMKNNKKNMMESTVPIIMVSIINISLPKIFQNKYTK